MVTVAMAHRKGKGWGSKWETTLLQQDRTGVQSTGGRLSWLS